MYRMSHKIITMKSWLFTQPFIQSADQRKHQSSASLDFVRRIHWWPMNSPHKGPVTRKMFPFDDVIVHTLGFVVLCFVVVILSRLIYFMRTFNHIRQGCFTGPLATIVGTYNGLLHTAYMQTLRPEFSGITKTDNMTVDACGPFY